MSQPFDKVMTSLKKGDYAMVYFLQGEENYFITEISRYIEQNAISENEKPFNLMILYGGETKVADIINNSRRFPMMAQRQVVIVKEAQDTQDLGRQAGEEMLVKYIANPSPSTILVFCYRGKKLDKRKILYKNLDKMAVVVDADRLYENQVPTWIKLYIESKGHTTDPVAVQMLADNIGNDLERLSNEIDKMLINFREPVVITTGMVHRYVGISKEYNPFELQKAIGARDVFRANKIVNYFSDNPKSFSVIPIIALLSGFFSRLLLIHHAGNKPEGELAKLTGISPYFLKEYIHSGKIYPLKKVIRNIHYIREADLMSKGIGVNNLKDGEILKELAYKLMHDIKEENI